MITVYGFRNESFWLGVDPEEIDFQKESSGRN
jgi:hypothetical protein